MKLNVNFVCDVLTKNASDYNFKDDNGNTVSGTSYKLGCLASNEIGELKVKKDIFDNVVTGKQYEFSASIDSQYGRFQIVSMKELK